MSKRKGKKYRPGPRSSNNLAVAMTLAAKIDAVGQNQMNGNIADAMAVMRQGAGADPGKAVRAWRYLADCANVSEELMRCGLANDHEATFTAAQRVLAGLADRMNAGGGHATLRAAELEALSVLALVHSVQLAHVSVGELQAACLRVKRRVAAALRDPNVVAIRVAGHLGAT